MGAGKHGLVNWLAIPCTKQQERKMEKKKFTVKIIWGITTLPDSKASTYQFDTEKEMEAFLYGVDEGNGWLDYDVVEEAA